MNKTLIEEAIKSALARHGYEHSNIIRSSVSNTDTNVLGIEIEYGMKPDKLYYKLDLTFDHYTIIWVETNEMGVPMSHLDAIKKAIKQARKEAKRAK